MKCLKCQSERVLSVSGWCRDCFTMSIGPNRSEPDYVPEGMGIGGGDELAVDICLDCGQAQGVFPINLTEKAKKRLGMKS